MITHLKIREHHGFFAVLAVFTALSIWYNLATPIGESDHEVSHFRYIQYFQEYGKRPPHGFFWPEPESDDQCQYPLQIPGEPRHPTQVERQFTQPPLYYRLSSAVFFWLTIDENWWLTENVYGWRSMNVDGGRNDFVHARDELYSGRETVLAVHVYRLFSTFLGALGLLGVYLTGLVVLPSKRHIGAMLFMGSVAFIPMYIFSSSVISNDILVGALGIWCIYFCLRSVLGKTN